MLQPKFNTKSQNVKYYGYPECTTDNIMTDDIYKLFFKSMLKDNLGQNESADVVIKELIKQIGDE